MCKSESVSKLELAIQLLQESTKEVIEDVSYLRGELSKCDLELTDLEHYIEFVKFNASEGYLIAKEMKEVMTRRREIKKRLQLSESLQNMIKEREQQINKLSSVTDKINKREIELNSKYYEPKVRMDLYERMKNKGVNVKRPKDLELVHNSI